MNAPVSTVELLERALALLDSGGRLPSELAPLVEVEIPAAMGARLEGRSVAGSLGDGEAVIAITSAAMAPCRVLVTLGADRWARVRLDSAGREVAPELEQLIREVAYRAGELPSDHRWWSDVGGLLMLGELVAG